MNIIRDTQKKDCKNISKLLKDNFYNFWPYKNSLSDSDKEWYSKLNSENNLIKKLNEKNYILNKVMLDKQNNLIWYRLAKLDTININWSKFLVLSGKRLHILKELAYTWLYDIWMNYTIQFVKTYNKKNTNKIKYLTWVPSNNFIFELYKKHWFNEISKHSTKSLQNVWIQREVPLVIKEV